MHRTEGTDYVLEDTTKRRFKDRNESLSIPGTIDTAEYNNAVQEEICYIIETVAGSEVCTQSAAADRSAGWHQLYDAIFDSAALTNAAISDLSVSKLTDGTIDITNGNYNWEQTTQKLNITYTSGTTESSSLLTNNSLLLSFSDSSTGYNETLAASTNYIYAATDDSSGDPLARCTLSSRGLRFNTGPGDNTQFKSAEVMSAMFDFSVGSWSTVQTGILRATGTLTLTGIPVTAEVFDVTLFDTDVSGNVVASRSVIDCNLSDDGTNRTLTDITVFNDGTGDLSSKVLVHFDGASLIGD